MKRAANKGFTLVELMATIVVMVFMAVYVGAGLMRLLSLDELNREKARALEKLSDIEARTQTLVAVGAKASSMSDTRIDIVYPYMVFGIVCETNYLVQVTNTTLSLPQNNAIVTTVRSGKRGGGQDKTLRMDFLDPLVDSSGTRLERRGTAPLYINGVVLLSYEYDVKHGDKRDKVGFAVPIRMRNTAYEEYPVYE